MINTFKSELKHVGGLKIYYKLDFIIIKIIIDWVKSKIVNLLF